MRYADHYKRLIERANGRIKLARPFERHHIQPRCLGGSDDPSNLVLLTPREHFFAHELLVKMYPGVPGLTYAVVLMGGKGVIGKHSSRGYEWVRRKAVAHMSAERRGKRRPESATAGLRAANAVRRLTDAQRAHLSEINMGKTMPSDVIEKIRAKNAGKKRSPEVRAAIAERNRDPNRRRAWGNKSRTGMMNSVETRARISAAHKGRKRSAEWRLNISKGQASISDDAVRAIRESVETNYELAAMYGTSASNVSRIRRRKSYAWVGDVVNDGR